MSSKAAKRRRELAERQRQRKVKEELTKNWICPICNLLVQSWSPVCLCGCLRPDPKVD